MPRQSAAGPWWNIGQHHVFDNFDLIEFFYVFQALENIELFQVEHIGGAVVVHGRQAVKSDVGFALAPFCVGGTLRRFVGWW